MNQKPVLYVLGLSVVNSCTKFQNFLITNKEVLPKKLSQFQSNITISRNKDGRHSAILNPISKSFELRLAHHTTILHIKFHEDLTNSL